jgi:hypothetical protein
MATSPPLPKSASDAELRKIIEGAKAQAVTLDPENLPETVASGSERRCPFLTLWSEAAEDEVDGLCDIRVQTFSDTPPFGPKDLKVCELCLGGKQFQMNVEQASQFEDMAENAKKAPPEPKEKTAYR